MIWYEAASTGLASGPCQSESGPPKDRRSAVSAQRKHFSNLSGMTQPSGCKTIRIYVTFLTYPFKTFRTKIKSARTRPSARASRPDLEDWLVMDPALDMLLNPPTILLVILLQHIRHFLGTGTSKGHAAMRASKEMRWDMILYVIIWSESILGWKSMMKVVGIQACKHMHCHWSDSTLSSQLKLPSFCHGWLQNAIAHIQWLQLRRTSFRTLSSWAVQAKSQRQTSYDVPSISYHIISISIKICNHIISYQIRYVLNNISYIISSYHIIWIICSILFYSIKFLLHSVLWILFSSLLF